MPILYYIIILATTCNVHRRSKEWKIQNLKTESERITGKERQEGGLTQGQATTLARNEQVRGGRHGVRCA